jgi:hypothetical protein
LPDAAQGEHYDSEQKAVKRKAMQCPFSSTQAVSPFRQIKIVVVMYTFFLEQHLHILRSSSTCDDFYQFSGNDSLSGSVVQDGESSNHVSSVL